MAANLIKNKIALIIKSPRTNLFWIYKLYNRLSPTALNDGERYDPNILKIFGINDKHQANRYIFATTLINTQDSVLDLACGTGYGSLILSSKCKTITGVDISTKAITFAKKHYNNPNLHFVESSIEKYCQSADIVVSFETIEHILQASAVLREFSRVLKPRGLLIISTPNAAVSSPGGHIQNPYHLIEYQPHEFLDLLLTQFPDVKLYGQKPIVTFPILRRWLGKTPNYEVQTFKKGLHVYSYIVAICTKGGF